MSTNALSALLTSLQSALADDQPDLGPVAAGDEKPAVRPARRSREKAVYRLDRDFRILEINDAALAHLNMSREVAEGAILWDIAPGLIGTACEAHYKDAMNGCACEFIGPSVARPGRFLSARMKPVSGGLEVTLRDVTA